MPHFRVTVHVQHITLLICGHFKMFNISYHSDLVKTMITFLFNTFVLRSGSEPRGFTHHGYRVVVCSMLVVVSSMLVVMSTQDDLFSEIISMYAVFFVLEQALCCPLDLAFLMPFAIDAQDDPCLQALVALGSAGNNDCLIQS